MKSVLVAAVVMIATTGAVRADQYPSRAVTIVVPAAPGGTTDLTGRLLAEGLRQRLGKTFIIENKGGASGNIGTGGVARAKPDGYTLLSAYSGYQVANPALFPKLDWDPVTSFEPIAMALRAPQVIAVRKEFPANTLQEFIAYAKANPGKVTYASSGLGSIQHIGSEQLSNLTGIKMVHVPYKGSGPAMNDLVGGQIDVFITTPPAVVGLLADKQVKVLAITRATRHPSMPNVPTTAEAGLKEFEVDSWFALYAPAKTPKAIIEKLAKEVAEVVKSPDFIRKASDNGADVEFKGPEELRAFTGEQLKYWSEMIKQTGIKLN